MFNLKKASKPTLYFIGVTTGRSSIMKLFPQWAAAMELEAEIAGIDIEIHAQPEKYREIVNFIKNDPLSMGALVTTHKIDLYQAASDMFEYKDPYAAMLGELSCISKQDNKLCAHAKDPISCGLAMESFIPENWWKDHGGDIFIIGAGGSAISMGSYLMRHEFAGNYPGRIIVSNRSQPRLAEIEKIFRTLNKGKVGELQFHLCPEHEQNDAVLSSIRSFSLIINATGLGKDRPGSPITDAAQFPDNSLVWEINYRGSLKFMQQALDQKVASNLIVEDGWTYFIHGWTQVIAEVFHTPIEGSLLRKLDEVARHMRRPYSTDTSSYMRKSEY